MFLGTGYLTQTMKNHLSLMSLASACASTNHNNADNAISLRIKESLKSEVGNRINFANDILRNN